jgi:osmotically inducible protein OsmC
MPLRLHRRAAKALLWWTKALRRIVAESEAPCGSRDAVDSEFKPVVQSYFFPFRRHIMQRKANARWQGTVKEGSGTLSVQSGTLKETPFSFAARFGDGKGTNPEELIAAAHAGCFTMALSFMLNNNGFTADAIDTEATLTLDRVNDAWTVTAVHLLTRARIPGIDTAKFGELASNAKVNCPISRLLNTTITLDAALSG